MQGVLLSGTGSVPADPPLRYQTGGSTYLIFVPGKNISGDLPARYERKKLSTTLFRAQPWLDD
jgi:hypothetical protein